ncbi:thiamine-monophosphate kinase [Nocardia sp. NBC_00565]|uniref:thiamine-monophosphate kinase n=1 Tax=Nocardia sp. NBC_00565 TaxID=2975993 RepID=UPI002E800197|nr:thiamine-monophosphate kinase [Nocardia sp. NBC_00565]WUC00034.1 thiamine-monophosphate kinase [Nocardia sp. NBC_00565]
MRELGEFALIERINAGRVQTPGVLLGPGDDAAVVAAPDGRFVVTTDMLIQDRHFRLDWSSPRDIGRKAIAQNAADVVAMGAAPTAFVVALGCPADTPIEVVDGLTDGMWAEVSRAGGSIAGGDVVHSPQLVISVTAFGDLGGRAPITRAGARVGDIVAVAGRLGWSAAGLAVLSAGVDPTAELFAEVLATHRVPQPPYSAVLAAIADSVAGVGNSSLEPGVLGSQHVAVADAPSTAVFGSEGVIGSPADRHTDPIPNALTDVSDGLLADLGHIAEASRVAIDLRSTALRDPALAQVARRLDADAAQWILTGGEDHAFVGTWPADRDLPPGWTPIGRVLAGHGVTVDGVRRPGSGGWESFSGVDSATEPEPR